MSTPSGQRPFPIPLVSAMGPGSQIEDEELDYLPMPQGMSTYQPPRLPEPDALDGHGASFIPDLRLVPARGKQQQRDRYDMGKTCHSIPMGKGRRGRPVHATPREWSRSATI